jgi:chromosome segregation ATPase
MKMALKDYFTKQADLEKLQAELSEIQQQRNELADKINQVRNAFLIAQAEYMIDNSSTTKKKVEKLDKGLKELEKQRARLEEKANKVSAELTRLNMEKRKAEIEAIADEDARNYELYWRAHKLKKLIEKLTDYGGIVTLTAESRFRYHEPLGLLKEAGVKRGYFDKRLESQRPFAELWEKKRDAIHEQVEQELAELEQKILDFLK